MLEYSKKLHAKPKPILEHFAASKKSQLGWVLGETTPRLVSEELV
jgi:hypothetical protein